MNDDDFDKQRARVDALHGWKDRLGLGSWHITHEFARDTESLEDKSHNDAFAVCIADWRYMRATIGWNLWQISSLDDRRLELTYLHEIMHVFLDEMAKTKGSLDHHERTAQMLALAVRWAREGDPVKGEY